MRRLMKFLHTLGAIGMMGAMACLLVVLILSPDPALLAEYVSARNAMAAIAKWVLMPSLGITLISGLLAIAINPGFHDAGWAWIKAASGILLFESGFVGILGPMQHEAELGARALLLPADAAALGLSLGPEKMTLWILLAVSTANVILGVWRPRLIRRKASC
jgi:hypothetical protein